MNRYLVSICFAVIFAALVPINVFASPFRDVPRSHFAYDAIVFAKDPANGAFMVGDAHGNFNPRRELSKFEAARAFALAAGFRHVLPPLSAQQQEMQRLALVTWRPYLDLMASEYGRWQSGHDGEMAFLLYKGILTIDDVNGFVTRQGQNEAHAPLTINDARLWTLRLASEGGTEARHDAPEALNRAITRAELAVMLHGALYVPSDSDNNQIAGRNFVAPIFYDFASEAYMEAVTISGRINDIRVEALSSITVQTAEGSAYSFYVTSNVMDILALRVGMLVTADVVGTRAVGVSIWGSAW